MKPRDGATKSEWYDGLDQKVPQYSEPPEGQHRAEVCIVGAGIAGLTTAYLMSREGKRAIVLDEGPIGSRQTGRTSAHLVSAIDDRFQKIERQLGEEAARAQCESHAKAIDTIERIAREEGIAAIFGAPAPTSSPRRMTRRISWTQSWRRPT